MKQLLRCSVLSLVILAAGSLVALGAEPTDETPPKFGGSFFLWTNSVAASGIATNKAPKRAIDVPANRVLALALTLTGTNASTSNVVVSFNGSLDGSTWTTDFPFSASFPTAGAVAHRSIVILGTNLPARYLSADKVQSSTLSTITISNPQFTFFPY